MFQSILSNLAIILLGHLLMSTLMNYRKCLSKSLVFICIVLLFSGVIITMFYLPIQFGEYRFDLRLIPLIFLALFRGWKATLPILDHCFHLAFIHGRKWCGPWHYIWDDHPNLICFGILQFK